MAQTIKGKTALITGAGKGIGKATAIALANEGVNVGLVARTEADLTGLAEQLKETGVKVAIATADISSLEQVNKAVEALTNELGTFDILINNAGIGKFGGFMDLDPEEWKNIVDVNLTGTYYVTRAVLPQLIEKQGGDIINISSTAGQKGAPATSAYSASKF
jgi:3-oxoacyl-[acyl-carrier protein] reductase